MRIRRTAYAFFYLEDGVALDLTAILQGRTPPPAARGTVTALAVLTGEHRRLSDSQWAVLLSVPTGCWVDGDPYAADAVAALTATGLLLSDRPDVRSREMRQRDETLTATEWNLYAALYHYMTQWSGVDIRHGEEDDVALNERTGAAARTLVARYGHPPPAFPPPRGGAAVRLPGTPRDGALYRTLTARRTTRGFNTELPMTLEQLDTVLLYVFGCLGYTHTAADVVCIKRTSPSGGGLHPVDAYPIISHVEGITPGIYRYNGGDHSLSLLTELDGPGARRTATSFMCGQSYFGTAHVSFVLTARYYRNHWKYRRHQKAYAGMLMDAAHLSQTLYLVSTELGLGAYVTIAINSRDIEARLELDGVNEGVLAMLGCGPRGPSPAPLEPRFTAGPPI